MPAQFPDRALALIGRAARIRPAERGPAAGAFLTMFGFMAGHAMLETARDALFLANWPASQLPWVYLGIAVFALALSRIDPRVMARLTVRGELSGWLLLASLVTLVFWFGTLTQRAPTAFPLYIWTGVIATLVVVRFWTLVSGMFTMTQAKRVFAVIGSGSILGAITGSAVARVIAGVAAPRHLVLGAAAVFAATSLAPRLVGTVAPAAPPATLARERWDLGDVVGAIRSRPYLRAVAVLVLISTVTFTFVDFVFKSRVDRLVPAAEMGTFFSSFYLVLNIVSLVVQLVGVGWLLRRVSVHAVHTIAPALLLVGAVGTAAIGALPAVLLLKGADGALRHSLSRTTVELLFVPVRVDLRARVKGVIDTIGQRGGQALASLVILVAVATPGGETLVAVLAALAAAIWLGLSIRLRQPYLQTFRETLRDEVADANIAFPELDVMSLEMLLRTLNDPDDRRVLAALDLLVAQGKAGVIPPLILFHPSAPVVVRALDIFQARQFQDALPIVNRLLDHDRPEVVTAAVRTHAALGPDPALLRRALADPAAGVSATALVALAHTSALDEGELRERLSTIGARGADALIPLCDAVRVLPGSRFDDVLIRAAGHADRRVRRSAVRAMGAVGSSGFVPVLLHLLSQRELRAEAAAALVATGPATLDALHEALRGSAVPLFVRRQVPLAMARFGSPRAARLLLRQLVHEADGMVRFKIIQALNALRAENPEVALEGPVLGEAIRQTLGVATEYSRRRHVLNDGAAAHPAFRTPGNHLLCTLLRDKQEHALERVFRLLNLLTGDETFARIHRSLKSGDPAERANARELALHLAPEEVQRPLVALVDDLYDAEVTTPAASTKAYVDAITALVEGQQESLATMAAYHVGELGRVELADVLTPRADFSDQHAEVITDVRERLLAGDRP